MKKAIICLVILISFFPCTLLAKEKIKVYFFYGNGCPHCASAEQNLLPIIEAYDDVEVIKYEVWFNNENDELLKKVQEAYQTKTGVPLIIIGNSYYLGYSPDKNDSIINTIDYYRHHDYIDQVSKIKNNDNIKINENFSEEIDFSFIKDYVVITTSILTELVSFNNVNYLFKIVPNII